MNRRAWLAGISALAIVAAGVVTLARSDRNNSGIMRKPAERPMLALLTSLPLVFGESFGLGSGGSPTLTRIEQRYTVQPIGVADAESLAGQRYLLMAHPRAQPAGALVDLDRWVRGGGKVLLLADPQLNWPSERPLGDKLRPPPAFADTGLLGHWGLTLSGARTDGPVEVAVGDRTVVAVSPGTLTGKRCDILGAGLIARCPIGKGMATVIADADLLNVEAGGGAGRPIAANLDLVAAELSRFERR